MRYYNIFSYLYIREVSRKTFFLFSMEIHVYVVGTHMKYLTKALLTLCLLDILHAFLSSVDLFSKINFLKKKSFRNTIRVLNSLDPDQARHFVGSDLVPNCLQRISADDKSHH